jgi:hypothetical protein
MERRKRRDERDQDLVSRHADLIGLLALAANLSVAGFICR